MSFVNRYTSQPSIDQITAIEGVTIIDQDPPANVAGPAAPTGVAALIGEFADCSLAVAVSSAGVVTSRYVPTEIKSGQDQVDKLGGFDSTIGDWGDEGGNGYAFLNGRKFTKLIVCPINIAGDYGTRLYRKLPSNASATVAVANPPTSPGVVLAGREFKSGANTLRLAKQAVFTASPPIVTGIIAATTNVGSTAATGVITCAGLDFTALGVQIGDAVVLDVSPATNFDTYRVTAVGTTTLTVQKQDGSVFDFATAVDRPFRVHKAADADTGGQLVLSGAGGYLYPARPTVQTIAAATNLPPTSVPASVTLTTADPLSGVRCVTHPSGGLTYVAARHAPNATTSTTLETEYQSAITALMADAAPVSTITVVASARCVPNVNTMLKTFAETRSQGGQGVIACIAPKLTVNAVASLLTTTPGVASFRTDRVTYSAPGLKEYLPSAVGTSIEVGDGTSVTDGYIDVHANAYMFSILSLIPPERNPGEPQSDVTGPVFAQAIGWQRATSAISLTRNDYIQFKQGGIAAPKFDSNGQCEFQSGITTSLTVGAAAISTRRMRDFVQDTIASVMIPFNKVVLTSDREDALVSSIDGFLFGLKNDANPRKSRIYGYVLDRKGGNTAERRALGIFKVITKVKMHPSADFLVVENQTAPTVVI